MPESFDHAEHGFVGPHVMFRELGTPGSPVECLSAERAPGRQVELSQRSPDGAHGTYHTGGYALASDSTDWRSELFGVVGSVRFEATSTNRANPVFLGIAAPAEVQRYLAGGATHDRAPQHR